MSLIKDNKTTKYALRKTSVAFWFCSSRYGSSVAGAASVSADEVASATTTVTSTTATPTRSTTETKEVAVPDYLELRKQMRRLLDLKLQKQRQRPKQMKKLLSKIMRNKPLRYG